MLMFFFVLFLLCQPLQKSPRLRHFKSDRDEICGRNVRGVNIRIARRSRISDMMPYSQDGGDDVISRRKVLPPGG